MNLKGPNLSPRERDYVIGLGWNHFFRCYDNQALRFLWFINGMEYQNNTPNIVIKNVTDGSNLELSKAGKDLDNTTITCQAFYRNGDNGISDEKVLFVQGNHVLIYKCHLCVCVFLCPIRQWDYCGDSKY